EIVEHLPGISEPIIEQHEAAAKIATVGMEIVGIFALGGLWLSRRSHSALTPLTSASLILGLAVAGQMLWTANLGGQIHHPEIRADAGAANTRANTERPSNSGEDD